MGVIVEGQYLQVAQVRHSHPVIIYSDKTIRSRRKYFIRRPVMGEVGSGGGGIEGREI